MDLNDQGHGIRQNVRARQTIFIQGDKMFRKRLIPVIAVAALALATFAGITGYRAVYAQATTPTPTVTAPTVTAPAQSGQSSGQQAVPGKGWRGGPGDQANNTNLAAALNITTDKLTAAYQAANTEALKQAVAKGLITQAQADQYAANAQNGRPFHFDEFGSSGIDYNALLAQTLNITTDQLKAAQTTAYNTAIDAAVKAGTMTQAQADLAKGQRALMANSAFQTSMKTAYDAAVKQAVSDGVITQAQADQILAAAAQQPNGFFGGFGPGMGHGGRGGHGGPDHFGAPAGTDANNSTGTTNGL